MTMSFDWNNNPNDTLKANECFKCESAKIKMIDEKCENKIKETMNIKLLMEYQIALVIKLNTVTYVIN